jgi:hypothetical protein
MSIGHRLFHGHRFARPKVERPPGLSLTRCAYKMIRDRLICW